MIEISLLVCSKPCMANQIKSKALLRVIVVEGNPTDAKLIEQRLKGSLACKVEVVTSRAGFIRELGHGIPDVIITNSNVLYFDGAIVLALAQKHCPETPIIFCSGNESVAEARKILALGAKAWICKDQLDRLVDTIQKLCGEK